MLDLDLRLGPWRLTLTLGLAAEEASEPLDLATGHDLAEPWPVGFTGSTPYDDEEARA